MSGNGTPLLGDVGVVAVTDDSWAGAYTTRHFMLQHLARFFRVAWLEPSDDWRARLRRLAGATGSTSPTRQVTTTGVEGVTPCQPLRWMPDLYRPRWLRGAVRASRYRSAASFLRRMGCRRVALYVWRPSYADALRSRQWFDTVVYHIDDEYTFSETVLPMMPDELTLIRGSDAVIVHSPGLAERKGGINKNTFVVPNGVDYGLYARPREAPADLGSIARPRIGYVGVIKKQLDLSLIRRLAERRSDWSFVLVGPLGNVSGEEVEVGAMSRMANVHFLGHRQVADLPAYQQHFDVAIMPYKLNAYTECIYPLKLHEYLASGKPVVASPVRTLRDFADVISLASGVEGWTAAIQSCLTGEARSDERVAARRAIAAQHDWRVLATRVASILSSKLGQDVQKRVLDAPSEQCGTVSDHAESWGQ